MRKLTETRIVAASHNAGKLVELAALLVPFGISVLSAARLGLVEPIETEDNFIGNARIKAHGAAGASGLPALADDSGIQVDALNGAPGVYTADWAETPNGRDFEVAMGKVWTMLQEARTPEPRTAQFTCILCLAWPDGHEEIFQGIVRGQLIWPMRGKNGFGFDPMFLPVGKKQTFGEMDPKHKHGMSHRAEAFRKLAVGCLGG